MDKTCLRAFLYNSKPKRWRQRIGRWKWITREPGVEQNRKCSKGKMVIRRWAMIAILCESAVLIWLHGGALSLLMKDTVAVTWEEKVLVADAADPNTGTREQGFLVNLKELTMKFWQTESFLIEESLGESRD